MFVESAGALEGAVKEGSSRLGKGNLDRHVGSQLARTTVSEKTFIQYLLSTYCVLATARHWELLS